MGPAQNETIYTLVKDHEIWWNANYTMIERAVPLEKAITLIALDHQELASLALSADDWRELELYLEVLGRDDGSHGMIWEVLATNELGPCPPGGLYKARGDCLSQDA